MQKTGQDHLKYYMKAISIFLVLLSVSLLLFFYGIKNGIEQRVEVMLTDNVEKQCHHFGSIIDTHFQYLEGIAVYLGKSEDLLSEENISLIFSVRDTSDISRISLIEANGTAHYDDGSIKRVSERRYFQEGISGKRTLSDPLESKLDGETRVVLGVPVRSGEEVVGLLGGSYDLSALSRLMFDDMYGGAGFSMILMNDGSLISYDDSRNVLQIAENDNFFDLYQNTYGNNEQLEAIKADFKNGTNGYAKLGVDNDQHFLAYSPLDYNNWMVCYMVPVDRTLMDYDFIQDYEWGLISAFFGSMLLLLFAILTKNRRSHKALLQYANTDALTGLNNKKNTEDSIQEWMTQLTQQHRGHQGFLIMDIDLFKEINDQLGHAAGDEVLRQIGLTLKTYFRENDILGRIGGDEFVIFMKNVELQENVEKRAAGLVEAIRHIRIPELRGKTISCSIGIAIAPEQGTSYAELYKHADMALYETKRKGKNGYSVYAQDNTSV